MRSQSHAVAERTASTLLLPFIIWSLGISGGLVVVHGVAYHVSHSPAFIGAAAAALALGAILAAGWRLVRRGRPWAAVLLVGTALFCTTLVAAAVDPGALPQLAVLPLLGVATALPYVSGRALRRLLVAAWLTAVGAAGIAELSPVPDEPLWFAAVFRVGGVGLLAGMVALLLWQLSQWMRAVFDRLETASDELRASRETIKALVDNAPDIIVRLDRSFRYLYVNLALERLIGLPPATFLGKTGHEAGVPAELVERWERVYADVLTCGRERIVEYETGHDDNRRWYEARVVPETAPDGSITSLLMVARDITDRRRAEEQRRLLEAELRNRQKIESLSVLAGGVAHDFNNLLGIILGNAELALLDLEPDAPARAAVEPIAQAARRAAELTRQLRDFAGRGRAVMQPLDLNQLLAETAPLLHATVPRNVGVFYHLSGAMPQVEADARQVRQVLISLVVNAAEAIGADTGRITITSGVCQVDSGLLDGALLAPELPEGTYAMIEVADTGPGMDSATRERIFEPFFTTRFIGRGLGLPAVLGVVQAHRGAVRVQSAPGEGTVFTVLLPAHAPVLPEPIPAPAVHPAVRRPAPSRVVLVVDDEAGVQAVAARMAERHGYGALVAGDGATALEVFAANRERVACVLLDLSMPQMDGEQTYRALRLLAPDARVVLMSGYTEEEAGRRFAGLGVAGFLQKPFTSAELCAVLQRATGGVQPA